jgi:hypothetical protein
MPASVAKSIEAATRLAVSFFMDLVAMEQAETCDF